MSVEQRSSTILDTLVERIAARDDEGLDIEFKRAERALPSSIWPTISAFANTIGGWIVLGVDETDDPDVIAGVKNASSLLDQFHSSLRNRNKINHPVCGPGDAIVESINGAEVIIISVPASPRKERPVFINNHPYDGTYVRRNSGDYRCQKQEVDRMMREASDATADSTILVEYDWNDLDLDTLARYRRRHQTNRPESPWNDYNDQRFLEALQGYRQDRTTGSEGITVAGLLLTGKPEAIRDWRTRHMIDYRDLANGNADTRWEDRVAWEGNLLGAYETIYPRLVRDLAVPFRLHDGARVDESTLHVALREALVNLLVHADYAETDVSLIERSPDGYRFRNPGSSRIPVGDLLTGDRSDPRNPILVRMFRLIGLAEEAGTGLPSIYRIWRERRFWPPDIDLSTERYEFSLTLPYRQLISDDDREWLNSLGGEWTGPEELALLHARRAEFVDNAELRSLTQLHSADATKVLVSLRNRNFLQSSGSGRHTRYTLGVLALGDLPLGLKTGNSGDKHESSGGSGSNSTGKTPNSIDKPTNSTGNDQSSADKTQDSTGIEPEPLTEETHAELLAIGQPARELRRLPPDLRDRIILQLCALSPLSLTEIAEYMDRNPAALRVVITSLKERGLLTYLYPQSPTHPQQKYVTAGQ